MGVGVTTFATMICNECGVVLDGMYDTDVQAMTEARNAGWDDVGEPDEGDSWWVCPDCLRVYEGVRDGR